MQIAIIISNNESFLSSQSLAKEIYEITNKPIVYISLCPREHILPHDYDKHKNSKYNFIARITYLMHIIQSSYNENNLFRINLTDIGKKFISFLEREKVGGLIALQPDIAYMKANFTLLITMKECKIPIIAMIDNQYTESFMISNTQNKFCTLLITDPKTSLDVYLKYNFSNKTIIIIDKIKYSNIILMQNEARLKLTAKKRKYLSTIIGANLKHEATIVNILTTLNDASYLIVPLNDISKEDNIDNLLNLVLSNIPKDKLYLVKFIILDNSLIYLSKETIANYANKNIFQVSRDITELLYTASDFVYETNTDNHSLSLIDIEHKGHDPSILNATIKNILGFTIWKDVDSVPDEEEREDNINCFCTIS